MYYIIVDLIEIIVGYMDVTSRFPRKSSRRNEYILVRYYFDTNHIRVIPIKDRRGQTITKV